MIPKKCTCRSEGKTPRIFKQPSLKPDVIIEVVCFGCGFWYPLVKIDYSKGGGA